MAFLIFGSLLIVALVIVAKENETLRNQPAKQQVFEYNLEAVKYAAYKKSLTGDRAAREWVLDNIFKQSQTKSTEPTTTKDKSVPKITSQYVFDESVISLIGLGMTKKEAKQKVKQLTSNKVYTSTEDVIMDAFKKC